MRRYAKEIDDRKGDDPYAVMLQDAAAIAPGSRESSFFLISWVRGRLTLIPGAQGVFVGLSSRHDRADLARAALEGVTVAMRHTMEIVRNTGLPVREFYTTGGGASSILWLQILADVFGNSVSTLNLEEGSAFGAVLLGSVAAGCLDSVEEACKATLRSNATYEPQPEATRIYDSAFRACRVLYAALKESLRKEAQPSGYPASRQL